MAKVVFVKISQISQDSADADAPASSIESTALSEHESVAKVNVSPFCYSDWPSAYI